MSEQIEIQDKREKGWFIIDNEVLENYSLTPVEFTIYCNMIKHSNYKTKLMYFSQKTFSNKFRVSSATVSNAIKVLLEKKLVVKERKNDKNVWMFTIQTVNKKIEFEPLETKNRGNRKSLMQLTKETSKEPDATHERDLMQPTKDTRCNLRKTILTKETILNNNTNKELAVAPPPPKSETSLFILLKNKYFEYYPNSYYSAKEAGQLKQIEKRCLHLAKIINTEPLEVIKSTPLEIFELKIKYLEQLRAGDKFWSKRPATLGTILSAWNELTKENVNSNLGKTKAKIKQVKYESPIVYKAPDETNEQRRQRLNAI